ncbi:MAG: YfcC family protein [Bacteroidia bacterium]
MAKIRIPHTYVLLFGILCLAAALSWWLPGGSFEREIRDVNGTARTLILADTFQEMPAEPQSWQVLTAFYRGFERQSGIIIFIFIVGGVFYILQQSRALDLGIISLVKRANRLDKFPLSRQLGSGPILISLSMLLFAIFGAVFGMSEETIPFVLIFVPLAISMGYDAITGLAMCFVGAALGFAGALLNPFTIGVAQGIAGLQPFSGLEFRLLCFALINLLGIGYVLWYAARIKQKPEKSFSTTANLWWREQRHQVEKLPTHRPGGRNSWWAYALILLSILAFSWQHPQSELNFGNKSYLLPALPLLGLFFALSCPWFIRKSVYYFILLQLGFCIAGIVLGVMAHGWFMEEIAACFLALGISSAISLNMHPDAFVKQFLDGARDIAGAALVVGLAAGILVILEDGRIIDSLLYHTADSFKEVSPAWAVELMFAIQTAINILVPSGSGQAALTMPVMAPLADLLGISRQLAVLAFQLGDGFTNLITPTSGVLIGVLGMARVEYSQWFRFMLPLQLLLSILGLLLLLLALYGNFPGF